MNTHDDTPAPDLPGDSGDTRDPDGAGETFDSIPVEPSAKPEPAPKIDAAPLTAGMSEDEIESIEREPEPPKKAPRAPEPEIPEGALGAPGRLGWRVPLIVGGTAMVIAVVLAAVYPPAETAWWKSALKQLIDAPLYAWLGVGAVLVVSRLEERPFGGVHHVVGRMAMAVGLFALIWQSVRAVIMVQEFSTLLRWPAMAVLGGGVYMLWVMFSYRLDRRGAVMLGLIHLVAWFVLFLFRVVE